MQASRELFYVHARPVGENCGGIIIALVYASVSNVMRHRLVISRRSSNIGIMRGLNPNDGNMWKHGSELEISQQYEWIHMEDNTT